MKRFLVITLALLLLLPCAVAEVDLSALSFEELRELSHQLSAEIMARPEWKETQVPAGEWVVGEDIPAGSYSITPVKSSSLIQVWEKAIDDYSGRGLVYNKNIKEPIGKIQLESGWIFTSSNPVTFAPPALLGF